MCKLGLYFLSLHTLGRSIYVTQINILLWYRTQVTQIKHLSKEKIGAKDISIHDCIDIIL